jgi:hypothetical protein
MMGRDGAKQVTALMHVSDQVFRANHSALRCTAELALEAAGRCCDLQQYWLSTWGTP